MKVKIYAELNRVAEVITGYYMKESIIEKSQPTSDTLFIVVEKYFFRNSSRASLSVVLVDKGVYTEATVVGSGGGQGLFFKFDWGASDSFMKDIYLALNKEEIKYEEVNQYKEL